MATRRPRAKRAVTQHGGVVTVVILRQCPKCGAPPGKMCQRYSRGGGYWIILKQFHPERRCPGTWEEMGKQ